MPKTNDQGNLMQTIQSEYLEQLRRFEASASREDQARIIFELRKRFKL